MNKPKKISQCAYCGRNLPVTDDHIPPKNLFPSPRTSNLITVPCCVPCYEDWSKDDEYFRAVILSSANVSDEPKAQDVMGSLLRSVSKSRGFAKLLIDNIKEIELVTQAGIYLGREDALKLDVARVDRVGHRIIRGLFFHEKKSSLPANYQVIAKIQQFGIEPILEKLQGVIFPKLRIIQDGVFCYTFRETDEDPNTGIWLLSFYEKLYFVGFTRPHP